jgi:hypothetical protein
MQDKSTAGFKIIVIAFSLVGVCVLYYISLVITPPFVPLNEVAFHEGTIIRTRGVITELSVTESGNVLIKLAGNQTELPLFFDSSTARQELLNLSYGDEIEVEGKVQVYRGSYELLASEGGMKMVTQDHDTAFVSQIAVQPEAYEGRKIRVVGYAEDVYTHVFYLCDETGSYRMRVRVMDADSSISTLQEGDKILAEGVFSYDTQNMRYELNLVGFEAL